VALTTGFTGDVTLAITSGTGTAGATLSGTATVAAVAGVASFADLSIDSVGTGYTLTAATAGVTDIVSAAFDITAGPATQLTFTVEPTDAVAGAAITPAIEVTARMRRQRRPDVHGRRDAGDLSGAGRPAPRCPARRRWRRRRGWPPSPT
jgi:hypothetical protein